MNLWFFVFQTSVGYWNNFRKVKGSARNSEAAEEPSRFSFQSTAAGDASRITFIYCSGQFSEVARLWLPDWIWDVWNHHCTRMLVQLHILSSLWYYLNSRLLMSWQKLYKERISKLFICDEQWFLTDSKHCPCLRESRPWKGYVLFLLFVSAFYIMCVFWRIWTSRYISPRDTITFYYGTLKYMKLLF